MASPQLEDGYTRIANELVEALAGIRFAGQEFQIMMAVARLTYGFQKKEDSISFGQLASMTGIPRRRVIELVQSLVQKTALYSANNGTRKPSTIGINKDYAKWVHSAKKGTSAENCTIPSAENCTIPSANIGTHQRKKEIERKGVTSPPPPCCPHEQILGAYHAACPMLPRVKEWSTKRQATLRARWNENPDRQNLEWWTSFFRTIAESDFLTGRKAGRNGPFMASIDWILAPSNFVKILEGNYANRNGSRKLSGIVSEATERSMQNAQRVLQRLEEEKNAGQATVS